jgi:DNA-binding NarL/FixJ family response regulator
MEDMLVDFGTEIVGPAARMADAIRLAREADVDLGVLDINLAGETTYPVADVLRAIQMPPANDPTRRKVVRSEPQVKICYPLCSTWCWVPR